MLGSMPRWKQPTECRDRSSARLSGPHREARPLRAIWGERILDYQPGSPERGGVVLGARQLSLAREVPPPREVRSDYSTGTWPVKSALSRGVGFVTLPGIAGQSSRGATDFELLMSELPTLV